MAVAVVGAAHAVAIAVPATKSVRAAEDLHPQPDKFTITAIQNRRSHPNLKVVSLPSDFGGI